MYYYTDPERENDPHAQPNIEVFRSDYWIIEGEHGDTVLILDAGELPEDDDGNVLEDDIIESGKAWFYAYGFIGCLWESDPFGPYESEQEALQDACN